MITVDASDLENLARGIDQYSSIMPKSVATTALRNAVRPTFRSAQRLAPVGKRYAPNGWGKQKGPKFARGGFTRRDIRIKMVPTKYKEELVRVAVGVSSIEGLRGWRTHFITRGFTDRGGKFHRKKDFLTSAFDYTIDIVRSSFNKDMALSFQRWARRNLPQGRF